jgi:hypothetical protein
MQLAVPVDVKISRWLTCQESGEVSAKDKTAKVVESVKIKSVKEEELVKKICKFRRWYLSQRSTRKGICSILI